jgi:hypothetical protein
MFILMMNNTLQFKEYNYHLILNFIFLAFFLGLGCFPNKISIKKAILYTILILWPLLSIVNDGGVVQAFGKALKILIFISLLHLDFKIKVPEKIILNYFFTIHILLFIFYLSINKVDWGVFNLPRFSGGYGDSNYIAAIFLMLYIQFNHKRILLLSLFTQSISGFLSLFLSKIRVVGRFNIIFIVTSIFVIVMVGVGYLSEWNPSRSDLWIDHRLVSLYHRLHSSILGINYVSDNYGVLGHVFGIGSGRSYEFADRVLHSYFTQTLVDHGFFFTLVLMIYASRVAISAGVRKEVVLFSIFMSLSIDLYSTLVFPLIVFIVRNLSKPVLEKN